jgi:zinc transport system substrate-binding protein
MFGWRRAVGPVVVAIAAITVAGCADDANGRDGVQAVAAFYPLAEAARQVGGDVVEVGDLTPAGAEPHDLEVTPDAVDDLEKADVAIVMGHGFQPAIETVADRRDGETVVVLDVLPIDDELADEDPHVWLDPRLMRDLVDAIEAALVRAAPEHEATFARNATRFRQRLAALDADFAAGLRDCERDEIVTAHDAFGHLARRYGLQQHAIAGVSPDEEPSPERLAELADLVEEDGVTTVFTESLVSPRIAETLAREAGIGTAVLNPLEGLTDDEVEAGDDYESVMRSNLAALRRALDCA